MRYLFFILICLFAFNSKGQNDTIFTSARGIADTVCLNFNEINCPSGRLLNRVVNRMDSTFIWLDNTESPITDIIKADYMYQLISEYNFISFDTNGIENPVSYYKKVRDYISENGEDRNLIPLGMIDFNFDHFNFDSLLNLGEIHLNGPTINFTNGTIQVDQDRVSIVGPVFDFVSGEILELILLEDFIISDDTSGIDHIEVNFGEGWYKFNIGESIEIQSTSSNQLIFDLKVYFNSKRQIENRCLLNTPENTEFSQKSTGFECDEENEITGDNGRKLKWCLLHGCVNPGQNKTWDKPFILVSGYRPPAVELKFSKLYDLYNTWHNDYIDQLRRNGYDVFMVKFNFDYKPYIFGTDDASELFVKFIQMVNDRKTVDSGGYHENVIQGNSMGADVVRLALIKMENRHFDYGSDHHHSRLFISDDANYYGANIPLSQQYLIKSKLFHTPITGWIPSWLFYLGANYIIEAKLFRELVKYHCNPNFYSPDFGDPHFTYSLVPTEHNERAILENIMYSEYRGPNFVPIPDHTRNIAISLGKIKENNSIQYTGPESANFDNFHLDFVSDGYAFADVNFFTENYYVRASRTGNYYQDLFKRKSFLGWIGIPFVFLNQKVKIKDMLAIDNASGSFLDGDGNFGATAGGFIIAEGILTLGPDEIVLGSQLINTKFTHKPVVSALAINKNLWPSNGSMTLDIHGLNLMYQNDFNLSLNLQSNHFGYPHLANPNTHFDITPFEAIYVDNQVHAHIDFRGSYDPFIDSLNNFLLNEVETWYLGLQNQNLGSQVLSNVTYKAERRAKFLIELGEHVTPVTNPNPYIAESNADLVLHAGQEIRFQPGVHIKNGAHMHAYIEYTDCSENLLQENHGIGSNGKYHLSLPDYHNTMNVDTTCSGGNELGWKINIFPVPVNNSYFYIEVIGDRVADLIRIYDIMGRTVKSQKGIFARTTKITHNLKTGVYLVEITSGNEIVLKKIIIE